MRSRIRRIRARVGGRWGGSNGESSGKEDRLINVEKKKKRKSVGSCVLT